MRSHETERLTLPDRKNNNIDAQQTTILPAIPEGQQRRSRAIRLPILSPDARSKRVSQDIAELIRHREQLANQETMNLQAFVIGQEHAPTLKEQSAPSFPAKPPPDTPPLSEQAIQKVTPAEVQTTQATRQKKKLSPWKILQRTANNVRRRRVPVL